MAESGLPLKYWADVVQTVVYTRNLLPNTQQPKTILAELWSGQCQDISHLCPFGCTSFAHIPLDLNISKLNPRSLKTALLGYFGHNSYKLLDGSTGMVFKLRDVIFEERITHLAKQPISTIITDDDDIFTYKPQLNSDTTNSDNIKKLEHLPLLIQEIAPRLLDNCGLHKETNDDTIITTTKVSNEKPNNTPNEPLLAIR